MNEPTGIESAVCEDIAERQRLGIAKYGNTVAANPLELRQWLQHAYEECLDQSVYLKRAMAEMDGIESLRAECQRLRVMVSAMADPVKITVPRELFENLIEYAIELRGERDWHKDEPRCGYQKAFLELVARIKESIALRDA